MFCIFLSKLAFNESQGILTEKNKKPTFYVISQRALLTPVPPADYVKSLVFTIKKGQTFDPTNVAEKLSQLGYLRVPRVTVRGEFTLRGEVLDIFMPGEEFAHRIVFDFDEVEESNINRQLCALHSTIGKKKVHCVMFCRKYMVARKRYLEEVFIIVKNYSFCR